MKIKETHIPGLLVVEPQVYGDSRGYFFESFQHIHTHDTLMMRDSVFTLVKGDTIRIERWHTLQAVNHIARIDTLWREKVVEQPVQVTTTEIKEVNRLRWWQTALMWLGTFTIGIGGGMLYWKFRHK